MTEEGSRKRKKGKKIKEANTRPRRSDFYRLEFFRPDFRATPARQSRDLGLGPNINP